MDSDENWHGDRLEKEERKKEDRKQHRRNFRKTQIWPIVFLKRRREDQGVSNKGKLCGCKQILINTEALRPHVKHIHPKRSNFTPLDSLLSILLTSPSFRFWTGTWERRHRHLVSRLCHRPGARASCQSSHPSDIKPATRALLHLIKREDTIGNYLLCLFWGLRSPPQTAEIWRGAPLKWLIPVVSLKAAPWRRRRQACLTSVSNGGPLPRQSGLFGYLTGMTVMFVALHFEEFPL